MKARLQEFSDLMGRLGLRNDRRITPDREIGASIRAVLRPEIPFLLSIIDNLHSIVLIGSGAFDQTETDSDVDIVIICEDTRFEQVADALLDRAVLAYYKKGGTKIDYTSLDAFHAGKYFRVGSPLAFAMRHGVVLWDDGFLEHLKSYHPAMPGREYYLDALKNSVVCQYYGMMKWLEDEIMKDHDRDGRCKRTGTCPGHRPPDNLALVIMNMLYVTLPRHGYMPLMTKDVLRFSGSIYGVAAAKIIDTVIRIKRGGVCSITFRAFAEIKSLAERLFREIVSIEEGTGEAGMILKDAERTIKEHMSVPDHTEFQEILA